MFCTKCGNNIPDGTLFCTKCGTKISAPGNDAPKAQETPTVAKETEAPVAVQETPVAAQEQPMKVEQPMQPVPEQVNEPAGKKKHTGLKVFLIILIILLVIAGGLVACWFFVVPQATKDYIFMQRELQTGDYKAVAQRFEFSEESIDTKEFTEYVKANFESGVTVKDLFDGNYVLSSKDFDTTLKYNDKTSKFNGDEFTYTFSVLVPSITSKGGKVVEDYYVESKISGIITDEYEYEFNAILGDDETKETNNLTIKLALKDGKLNKIASLKSEKGDEDSVEYAQIKDNKLYINFLAIDEDYANRVANDYAYAYNAFYTDAVYNGDKDKFFDQYGDNLCKETYGQDYDNLQEVAEVLQDLGYNRSEYVDEVDVIPSYRVGDTCIIIPTYMEYEVAYDYDYESYYDYAYLLVRPEDSLTRVIYESVYPDLLLTMNDEIDASKSYEGAMDAYLEGYGEKYGDYEEEFANNIEADSQDFSYLDEDEKDAYYDALMDAKKDNPNARFTMITIGGYYPLLVVSQGEAHVDASALYIYNDDKDEVVDLGYFGEYGELRYLPYGSLLWSSGGGMGYYTDKAVEIYDGEIQSEVTFATDTNYDDPIFYIDDVEVTEEEFNDAMDSAKRYYDDTYFAYVTYRDCEEITDEAFDSFFD